MRLKFHDVMKISGFTFVRNGFTYGYPFIQSIQSILPIVDELVVVVGDSTDGSREAIVALNDDKIKVVDTVWDDAMRSSGKIFAQQANLGIEHITGDWALHIQADEVLHESVKDSIIAYIHAAEKSKNADGLLFPYYHFWGDYQHIRHTRRTHAFEVRAFRNTGNIFSYKDSQGFRKYSSKESYEEGESGEKLNVLKTDIRYYHYSYTRHPKHMKSKANYFHRFWHSDEWLKKNTNNIEFDFNKVDKLEKFSGDHPKYMQETIAKKDWDFTYDPSKSNMRLKDLLLNRIEKLTGKRLFTFKNYKIV